MKFIIAITLFLLAYGSSAKQTDHIELLEYIIKKIEKEYVWPVDQKTLIKYATESVLDKLSSELRGCRQTSKVKENSYLS